MDIGGGTGFIQKFTIDPFIQKKIFWQNKYDLSSICGGKIDMLLSEEILSWFGKYERRIGDKEKLKILTEAERIKEALSFDEIA